MNSVSKKSSLVVRSSVQSGQPYGSYKQTLRVDFTYTCAYCTITEQEATSLRHRIDHYEPVSVRPDLKDEYSNLMWCCDTCNIRKGNRTPPPLALSEGRRFFRPDTDIRSEHFFVDGLWLRPISNIGAFTIDYIDLNRLHLQKLRDIRRRLYASDEIVAEGVAFLRDFRIDELPSSVRLKAKEVINKLSADIERSADDVSDIIAALTRSLFQDDLPIDLEEKKKKENARKKFERQYGKLSQRRQRRN